VRLSHYRLTERLGAGGMGEVYRAVDERLGREVAIKLLVATGGGPARQLRFLREAQAASALNHPGIVTIHDVGRHDGRPFLVMELVDGVRFSELVGAVRPTEALALCAAAADALGAAHARGILHRDIKSDNLMRTRDGRVKVLDFGLAKLLGDHGDHGDADDDGPSAPVDADDEVTIDGAEARGAASAGATPLTQAGDVLGTPAYMAPEQAAGRATERASEIFSLGVVAYELLVGRRPFAGATTAAVLEAVRRAEPTPPSVAASRPLPPGADAVLARALAREPADRYGSMEALAAAMRALIEPRRRRPGVAIAAAGVAAAAGVVAVVAWRGGDDRDDRATHAALRPIEPRRVTHDEGCEQWPTFTPDGDTVIFNGESGSGYALFALDLVTGARRQLTATGLWDYAPALSPDGTRLAFLRRGDNESVAHVAPAATPAAALPLVIGRLYPAWSPDGHALWAGSAEQPARRRVADGAIDRRLTPPPGLGLFRVLELDDGRVVAIASAADSNAAGKGVVLYPAGAGPDDAPTWLWQGDTEEFLVLAPDGDAVIGRPSGAGTIELWRVPLDGSEPRIVPSGVIAPTTGLAISADGRRIAWSDCVNERALATLVPVGDTGLRAIPITRGRWAEHEPVAVPGTGRVVAISERGGAAQIWELDPDGRAEARPLPTPGLVPVALAVSHDGAQVAFATDTDGLHVMPRDGSAPPRQVTPGEHLYYPVFTRDGRDLLLQWYPDGVKERVAIVPVAGGTPRVVLDEHAGEPAASPTADVIAVVVAPAPPDADVVPVLLDPRTLRKQPLPVELAPGWYHNLRFSPDGSRLVVLEGGKRLREIDLARGVITREYHTGTGQFAGVTYRGDELIAGMSTWKGDLWIGDLR
jgi:eukaryotic-like serine/threonine-protein kinase